MAEPGESGMDAKARLGWVKLHERIGVRRVVCRRCSISEVTLRKWPRRYAAEGEAGLLDRSKRPRSSPGRKIFAEQEQLILTLRRQRKLGIKRPRNELIRHHGLKLALDTIHKVLVRHGENLLKRPRLRRKGTKRCSRPVPGDRVQMDVRKIAPGLYRYTAIDDRSRFQVLRTYPRKTAKCTLGFLDQVLEEMPFAVQRIRTDRGQGFFAHEVQDRLREWCIKFRPVRPRSPHLNGKVERAQRTALEEFWPTIDLAGTDIPDRLAEWQRFCNWQRPHDSLGGRPPIDRVCELLPKTPLGEAVIAAYDPAKEFIRVNGYAWDSTIPRPRR